jgi:hypothetical protein
MTTLEKRQGLLQAASLATHTLSLSKIRAKIDGESKFGTQ